MEYERCRGFRNNYTIQKHIKSKLMYGKYQPNRKIYLSIVIPTYNRLELLKFALESVMRQSLDETIEVIVVDNSGDLRPTNEVLGYIKTKKYNNVLLYTNRENLGLYGNLNRCIQLARGKYVAMLHDDDLLCDNYLVTILKYINDLEKESCKLGAIRVSALEFSGNEIPCNQIKNNEYGLQKITKHQCLIKGEGPTAPPTCGMIFNKKAVLEIGGFDASYYPSADCQVGFFMLQRGYKVYRTKEKLAWYRQYVNESYNWDTISKMVKADYYLRQYIYSDNWYFRIIGKIFEPIHYKRSIDSKERFIKHKSNKKSELDFRNKYKDCYVLEKIFKLYACLFDRLRGYKIMY